MFLIYNDKLKLKIGKLSGSKKYKFIVILAVKIFDWLNN